MKFRYLITGVENFINAETASKVLVRCKTLDYIHEILLQPVTPAGFVTYSDTQNLLMTLI
jgi:hypothetical protein